MPKLRSSPLSLLHSIGISLGLGVALLGCGQGAGSPAADHDPSQAGAFLPMGFPISYFPTSLNRRTQSVPVSSRKKRGMPFPPPPNNASARGEFRSARQRARTVRAPG